MQLNLNLKDIPSNVEFSTIPPGNYTAVVSNCEMKTSQAGNQYLSAEFTLHEQPYTNRKIFEHFVLNQKVALTRLKSMAIAGQHPNPDYIANTAELIGLKLMIKVVAREDKEFGLQNKIIAFKPIPSEEPSPDGANAFQLDLPI